jgi:putative membrane protein
MLQPADRGFPQALGLIFLAVLLVSAIGPVDPAVWALENLLVLTLAGLLAFYRRELTFSRASWAMLFVFLCAHEIGAHYTYSQVPYDSWLQALTGLSLKAQLGVERNHFDRVIHLGFGLLLTQPIREVLLRTTPVHRNWSYVLPVALSMAASSGYEMVEWLASAAFGDEQGAAFVGAQGDAWDAQKDMALATFGAAVAMIAAAWLERGRLPDVIGSTVTRQRQLGLPLGQRSPLR